MGDPDLRQPIRQRQQLHGHGPKCPELSDALGLLTRGIGRHAARHHRLLMHIQPRTMGKDHLQAPPPGAGRAGGTPDVAMLSCVLRFRREAGDIPWYLEGLRVQLYELVASFRHCKTPSN